MRITRVTRVAPVLATAVLVTLLTAGSGAVPVTANRAADNPRTSPGTSAAVPPSATIAKTESQSVATPPINVPAYEACLTAPPSNPPQQLATTLAGWSDVNKIGEAEAPGFPQPASAVGIPPDEGFISTSAVAGGVDYNCARAMVSLDYQGQQEFPPVRATFTAFGFEPVTATAYLIQDGTTPFTAVNYIDISDPYGSTGKSIGAVTTGSVRLRLADVTVNGTPVDVGGDCRTTGPLTSPGSPVDPDMLVLAGGDQPGDPQPFYDLTVGGALAGMADIPSFTGCVTPAGENLDALLDATVSGPDNYVQIQQGPACIGGGNGSCTPAGDSLPGPLWTVTAGGPYVGTSTTPLTITTGNPLLAGGMVLTCTDSQIAGTIPDTEGPPRGAQLTFGWTSISDCTGSFVKRGKVTSSYGTFKVTMEGSPSPALSTYAQDTDTVSGPVFNVTLDLAPTALSGCTHLQVFGNPGFTYSDSSSTLTMGAGVANASMRIVASDCTQVGLTSGTVATLSPATTYAFNRHIQIASP